MGRFTLFSNNVRGVRVDGIKNLIVRNAFLTNGPQVVANNNYGQFTLMGAAAIDVPGSVDRANTMATTDPFANCIRN